MAIGQTCGKGGGRTRAVASARLLALATVLDDLADRAGHSPHTIFSNALPRPVALDALVLDVVHHADLSDSACVCALVYLGRVDAGACPGLALTHDNLHCLLVAALAIAAAYVDRRHPRELVRRIAEAVALSESHVALLRDSLVELLRGQTYISVATFREYDTILDSIINVR